MSGAIIIVIYPRTESSNFNKDYYLSTHLPMVEKLRKPLGLKSWTVGELNPDAPYLYTVVMEFESYEAFGRAIQDPGSQAFRDDVHNFSTEKPIFLHDGVIGRG